MKIIFEDNDIIICEKEVGILSEEGTEQNPGMPLLLAKERECKIYPVHRLDKAVGGLMVFAKNKESAASLSKQIEEHTFVKMYHALVYGKTEDSAVLEDLLFKDKRTNKTYVVKRERKGVKKAKLSFEKIGEGTAFEKEVSLVRVRLFTGRSHQIRVQFASKKNPLVGDRRYGSKDEAKNIELFSCFLSFVHPKTKEKFQFELTPNENMLMSRYF